MWPLFNFYSLLHLNKKETQSFRPDLQKYISNISNEDINRDVRVDHFLPYLFLNAQQYSDGWNFKTATYGRVNVKILAAGQYIGRCGTNVEVPHIF